MSACSERYVWYCSYGSNINTDRFNVYLKGGTPKGTNNLAPVVSGSRCSQPALLSQPIILHNCSMVFSRTSRTWNGGGVCFIDTQQGPGSFQVVSDEISSDEMVSQALSCSNVQQVVLGRVHKVLWTQFVDVVSQENGFRSCHDKSGNDIQQMLDHKLDELLEQLLKSSSCKLLDTWYGNLVLVGHHPMDNCPIFTFTSTSFENEIPNRANELYLKTIGNGLMECFKITPDQLSLYLLSKRGVKEHYGKEELIELFSS